MSTAPREVLGVGTPISSKSETTVMFSMSGRVIKRGLRVVLCVSWALKREKWEQHMSHLPVLELFKGTAAGNLVCILQIPSVRQRNDESAALVSALLRSFQTDRGAVNGDAGKHARGSW